jgi:hypothetical protein
MRSCQISNLSVDSIYGNVLRRSGIMQDLGKFGGCTAAIGFRPAPGAWGYSPVPGQSQCWSFIIRVESAEPVITIYVAIKEKTPVFKPDTKMIGQP